MKCYFSFMPGPGSGQACGREVGVHFSYQDQVSDNQAVRNWTSIFFQFQPLTIMQSGTGRSEVAATTRFSVQAHVSDNHAVRNLKFIFFSNPLNIMQSGVSMLVFCNNHKV